VQPQSLILAVAFALGGESSTGNSTGVAVIAAVSLVVGYAGLAALWYFVFRRKRRSGGDGDSSD
jgi:O-antigen/teichoic acid export membrane protein